MPLVDIPAGTPLDGELVDLPAGTKLDTPGPPSLGQAIRRVIPSLGEGLSAAFQRTSPVVNTTGEFAYTPLGEAGPLDSGGIGWIDQSGMHKADPSKHVILNDPNTGKPTVFLRGPKTDENVLLSLGRLLGFGAMAPSTLSQPSRGLLAGTVDAARRQFTGPEERSLRMLGGAMRDDMAVGGPGPTDVLDRLAQMGQPGTVLDVAGENVRGFGGQAARTPGPGRQAITETLNARDVGAGARLSDATSNLAASGPGTFRAAADLEAQARAAASPLYGRFEMAPPLNPDALAPGSELDKLLRRPSMQQAARNALKTAAEEGRDPASLGITFNAAGDPVFERVPSWRTLQDLKGGVDDVLETYGRNAITGKLELDTQGRAVDQTRRALINFIDKNNEFYAPARAAYAGPQANKDALEQGARIFQQDPDAITAQINALTPTQQQFYRLAAANALKTRLASTSSGGDEARALIGNELQMQRLRAVFPRAEELIAAARNEKTMFDTRYQLLGGSQTAPRLAQDTAGSSRGADLLRGGVDTALALTMHEPAFAARTAFNTLRSLFRGGQMTPDVGQNLARFLLSDDPATARAWLQSAFDMTTTPRAPPQPRVPALDLAIREFMLQPGEHGR